VTVPRVDRRRRLVLPLVAAAVALAGLLGGGAAPVAAAASDSLGLTTSTIYTLVPAKRVVRVAIDVTARNNKPNRVSGGVVTRYFYDSFRIGVQPEARSIRASSGGASLGVSSTPGDGFTTVEIRFRSSLFFGQTAKVHVTFDLPGGAPRSKSEVRVGPAFGTFVAWAFGDSGSVRIVIPKAFDTDTSGSPVTRTTSGSSIVLSASSVTDIGNWYVVVNADRPSALTSDQISLPDGEEVVIHAWPDDPVWHRQVTDLLSKGLPQLVELTGLDWPVLGELAIFEVHTPLLEGYAGVFFEGENRIEVSEDLDDLTILHEASHAWFNGDLFQGRWINEGFADTYASRSLDAIGLGGWTPGSVDPTDRAAVKLNDWAFPGRITDEQTDAREQYGYDASWTVIRSIVTEVGLPNMQAVLNAAELHQIAYVGPGTPETIPGSNDWRRLLDLLDEIGKSKTADDIFRRWVVSADDLPKLDERAAARGTYATLVAHGGAWLTPIYVRRPMSDWSFSIATNRITDAEGVLAKRDELTQLAGDLGLTPPSDLRTAYQTADQTLDAVTALADREIADAQAIRDATAAVTAPRDAVIAVGLMGTAPEARLDAVRSSFSQGAVDTAAQAAALSGLMASAAEVGRGRIVLGGVLAITVLVVLIGLVLLARRRRQHRLAAAGSAPPPAVHPAPLRAMAHPDPTAPYATLADPATAGPPDGSPEPPPESRVEPPETPETPEKTPEAPDEPAESAESSAGDEHTGDAS
jgi:hypothetical protein